jgi:citrate lyase subunit beta/citryl-CoA lyase
MIDTREYLVFCRQKWSDVMMRSKLFVPGSRPELFEKALSCGADAVSFDLEDAVVSARKAEAREAVRSFLRGRDTGDITMIVRVNGQGTEWHEADIAALAPLSGVVLNLPKVESADELRAIIRALPLRPDQSRAKVLANIESAAGLLAAGEIARVEGVMGLQIGFGDLFISLNAGHDDQLARHVRTVVRIAAAAAEIACFDSAFVDVANEAGFRAEAQDARTLGFSGKSCIHPKQIRLANEVFRPTEAELVDARAVLDAAEAQPDTGAFMLNGRMVDLPFIAQARARLAQAGESSASEPKKTKGELA